MWTPGWTSSDWLPRGFALALAVLLAGCTPPMTVPPAPTAPLPPGFPGAHYKLAAERGDKILRVDGARSLVLIQVYRGGTLARLGHDHVVASHDLRGFVDLDEGQTDLYLSVEGLAVDEPGLRSEAGFSTRVTPEVAEGTRHNMLERVLSPSRFPFVLIHATGKSTDGSVLTVAITFQGATKTFQVPVQVETGAGGLVFSGRMAVRQSDFGLTPLSILGGALQVQDGMELRFRIVASAT